jgi:hypothetical protein
MFCWLRSQEDLRIWMAVCFLNWDDGQFHVNVPTGRRLSRK